MVSQYGHDFTENLEAVARGVRHLEDIPDPLLRDAIRAALGLPPERPGLDDVRRARLRQTLLTTLPRGPRLSDRFVALFTVLAFPAPYVVRALALCALVLSGLAGTIVASADSMPDDALYQVKVAAEQFRLALAVAPADRAAVELSLAEHRLSEAERLASDGWESGALVATSAYAAHLASAAAELSEVDEPAPRAIALVQQLEARVGDQRVRAADTAQRLMSDPRTALAGVVLNTIASTPHGAGSTAATRVAEGAAAVTSRLASVADERAKGRQPLATALSEILGRRPVSGPVDEDDAEGSADTEAAEESDVAGAVAGPTPLFVVTPAGRAAATARQTGTSAPTRTTRMTPARVTGEAHRSATPRPSVTARPEATADPSARVAAEKVKQSAAKAKAAVERTKAAAKRAHSPTPTRTPAH